MPTLIDVATVRQHVETGLTDPAVQRLLDDADAAIIDRYGPHAGNVTVDTEDANGLAYLVVDRPVNAVVSITEYRVRQTVPGVVLAVSDWQQIGPRMLERLTTGANPRSTWGERVVLVYSGTDEAARRTFMEIDLVKLAAKYEALRSEGIGDYQSTHLDYEAARQGILGRMRGRRLPFA